MTELRILTVRQPWAWAIIHGGKDVENRVRNIAGDWRGKIAIHVGLQVEGSPLDRRVAEAAGALSRAKSPAMQHVVSQIGMPDLPGWKVPPFYGNRGAIIGVVDLVDVHHLDSAACYDDTEYAEDGMYHLILKNPRPLAEPIPYRGALGLRRLDEETTAAIWPQIGCAS